MLVGHMDGTHGGGIKKRMIGISPVHAQWAINSQCVTMVNTQMICILKLENLLKGISG
jgi:hypothetical protein